jgi:hypothetical protein
VAVDRNLSRPPLLSPETERRPMMPIILWLLGVPLGLVIVLWFLHVI